MFLRTQECAPRFGTNELCETLNLIGVFRVTPCLPPLTLVLSVASLFRFLRCFRSPRKDPAATLTPLPKPGSRACLAYQDLSCTLPFSVLRDALSGRWNSSVMPRLLSSPEDILEDPNDSSSVPTCATFFITGFAPPSKSRITLQDTLLLPLC